MAGKNCSYTPKKVYGEGYSTLYGDLLKLTNKNREKAKRLYALYGDKNAMIASGINPSIDEPSAVEFLDKTGIASYASDEIDYPSYINRKEELVDAEFESWTESAQKISDLQEKYSDATFVVVETDDKFSVLAVPSTDANKIRYEEQKALASLNERLINYMANLGFAVSDVNNLETPGKFSPISARKNADNLIEIIQLSKGIEGQRALPEEFAHMIFEGTQSNPITKRLLNSLKNNPEVIEFILGENYDKYNELYDYDIDILAREAAAKLIAQNLADRSGIAQSVKFISDKYLNYVAGIFKKGDESDIKRMLQDLQDSVDKITESITSGVIIKDFSPESVLSAREMYMAEERVSRIGEIADNSLKLLAKRIKILNLRRKNGKFNAADAIAYEKMKKDIDKGKYARSISSFLSYALADIKDSYDKIKELKKIMASPDATVNTMKRTFSRLRTIETIVSAYSPIVEQLQSLSEDDAIASEVSEETIGKIEASAKEVGDMLKNITKVYKDLRYDSLFKFYKQFWGEDKTVKGKTIKLEDILQSTTGDTNVLGRLINSMSNMPDPLLQLVDIAYKNAINGRDRRIYEVQQRLGEIQKELVRKTGSRDTSFAYVFVDGKPTGMLKSNIDYSKYYKEKREYYESLKKEGLSARAISSRLNLWVNHHTEKSKTGERMPKQSLYPSNDYNNLTSAQKEYLDAILEIKTEMDNLIPRGRAQKYRAPQKKISASEAILTKGNVGAALKRFKDNFVESVDDTDFGEELQNENGKYVLLDFSGSEVKKIPVFYTTFLDDMSVLDTNLTDTMLSYASMAINYDSMSNIANALELTSSQMQDRKILQTNGERKLREKFRIGKDLIVDDYKKPGATSELAKKLRNYIDANVYNRRKQRETINIGNGKEINVGKIGDSIVRYNSLVGLGYNLFSGATNVSMGIAQTFIHAAGGKDFGFRDVAKAHVWYNKDLAGAIADQYQDKKKNKLNLLISRFDALEEFYQDLNDSNYYGGIFKKMVGKHNPLIFNSMGEHYLHSIGMLSVLHHEKVMLNGKKVSLYDALSVQEKVLANGTKINEIGIEKGTKKLDGTEFTEQDLVDIKLRIQDVNHRMHGAFNQIDIGDLNRNAIGRLIKQYRQWMPAFFMDRFKTSRLNVTTGKEEEGFYITAARTIFGMLNDAFHLKFNVATRWGNLTTEEKANCKMAFFEVGLLYLIVGMLKYMGGPDKDDPWIKNAVRYNFYRLKMELGAAAPTSRDFLDNWKTLINSPVPAMENIDRVINVLDVTTLFEEIESGKYKGWNRWLRNAYFAAPYARNIGRAIDLVEGDVSMFTPYIKGRKN